MPDTTSTSFFAEISEFHLSNSAPSSIVTISEYSRYHQGPFDLKVATYGNPIFGTNRRIATSDDKRHNGNTANSYYDGHAEVNKIVVENFQAVFYYGIGKQ